MLNLSFKHWRISGPQYTWQAFDIDITDLKKKFFHEYTPLHDSNKGTIW